MLLQRRKGIPDARRRWNASTAPGVGFDPTCRFPDISIRNARINGRARGLDIFDYVSLDLIRSLVILMILEENIGQDPEGYYLW